MRFIKVNHVRVSLRDQKGKTGESVYCTVQVLQGPDLLLVGNIGIIIMFWGTVCAFPSSAFYWLLPLHMVVGK